MVVNHGDENSDQFGGLVIDRLGQHGFAATFLSQKFEAELRFISFLKVAAEPGHKFIHRTRPRCLAHLCRN